MQNYHIIINHKKMNVNILLAMKNKKPIETNFFNFNGFESLICNYYNVSTLFKSSNAFLSLVTNASSPLRNQTRGS